MNPVILVGTSEIPNTSFVNPGQLDKFQLPIEQPARQPGRPNQPSMTAEVQIGTNARYLYTKDYVNAWTVFGDSPTRFPDRPNQPINTSEPAVANRTFQRFPDAWQHMISQPTIFGGRPGQAETKSLQIINWTERTQPDKWLVTDILPRPNTNRLTLDWTVFTALAASVFSLFPDRYMAPDIVPQKMPRILAQDTGTMPQLIVWASPPRIEQFQYDLSQPSRFGLRKSPNLDILFVPLVTTPFTAFPDRYTVPDIWIRAVRVLAQDTSVSPQMISWLFNRIEAYQYDIAQPTRFGGKPGQADSVLPQLISWIERTQIDKWNVNDVVPARFGGKLGVYPDVGPYPFPAPSFTLGTNPLLFDISTSRFFILTSNPSTGLPYIRPL